jgi:predicted transcriptional regulator
MVMRRRRTRKFPADPPRAPEEVLEALLRNPMRQQILELLENRPGMNKHQLALALGVRPNAVEFQLDRLTRAGLVARRPSENPQETLCFTRENVNLWDDESTRMLFGRSGPRDIAVYLAQHPRATVSDVSEALGVSVHTVRKHLRTLEDAELVQRLRVERQTWFHAEPTLRDWAKKAGHFQPSDHQRQLR